MNTSRLLTWAISAAFAIPPSLHATQQKHIDVHKKGTTSMAQARALVEAPETSALYAMKPKAMRKQMPKPFVSKSRVELNQATSAGLVFGGFPIVAPDKTFSGFDALDSTDSGEANGFVVEPPDQGLATNGEDILEPVNLALRVFTKTGAALTPPVSLNAFFGVPTAPNKDGTTDQLSDPRAFYDWESKRWFVTILEYATTPAGNLSGGSEVLVAVSDTSDVLGSFTVQSIDVSDASFGQCPCLGDQPLLGLNKDGVYLNTNEYSNTTGFFQTALLIAVSKRDLIAGSSSVSAAGFDGLPVAEGQAFSIQPSFPSPGTSTTENRGTEYLVSSLDFTGTVDNRLAVWSLTNTQSLNGSVPNLNLQVTVITTQEYGQPVPAVQRPGSYPLGQSLGEPEEAIDTGDDRLQQVFYSQGKLYTGLTTVLLEPKETTGPRAGAAWFAIEPNATFASLSAKIWKQGLIGIDDGSVMYPAFAVNAAGDGVIAFSLTGQNYFPSTGYVDFSKGSVSPKVHLAGIGQTPDDGFSGYPEFGGGGVGRWGDYSAAMVSPNGDLWMAAEYIPNTFSRPRTKYTNWGTFIYQVH
ncbi:hypothetical protein [Tunturiibacter gelidoferens]|uniref:Uncharacterized protein n=2 Tax=Tunturiibacter gelidiferens TaxID=3069689 RepID=A0AAU7Z5B7_9BACT|nr:hypothetical protein [Edaphobacter lichenicola]MBB5339790.1 hypothetical protein [Edaphobacter lichenicola]